MTRRLLPLLAVAALAAGACDLPDPMRRRGRLTPLEPGTTRVRPEGVVPHGEPYESTTVHAGRNPEGELARANPLPVTALVLERGRGQYDAFCAPCHGLAGEGLGMVVRRGFPRPPSLHERRLREAPAGHFFSAMTEGFGRMPSYRTRLSPDDRWAVVHWIRVLQLSQRVELQALDASERQRLDALADGAVFEEAVP